MQTCASSIHAEPQTNVENTAEYHQNHVHLDIEMKIEKWHRNNDKRPTWKRSSIHFKTISDHILKMCTMC